MIYRLGDSVPKLAADVFVAPDAAVIGDVEIGEGSGVWFGCVLRGDVHSIRIGRNCNIQDLSMLHVTGGKFDLQMGDNCTLGHRVTLHGCRLKDFAFVGIGATVMDDCELGEYAFLGAGSLLPPGKKVPPGMLALGSPARVIREVTEAERQLIESTAIKYRALRDRYRLQNGFGLVVSAGAL
ncbi:MAG: gamma carbonic anhydrase family protein [Leptospirales bacterium]|nr:gamma carbonic anhydrase family protein [Leptospirales bacterium]